MKTLSDYTQAAQTKLFNETLAFFAFSQSQFNEAIEGHPAGTKYVAVSAGMICPKQNVETLVSGLNSINAQGVKQDLAENGKAKIIQRELSNYECQISGDYSEVVEILEDYGITKEEVAAGYTEFFEYCCEHDMF
jgi:hypothetical protein